MTNNEKELHFRPSLVTNSEEDTHGYYDIAEQVARAFLEFSLPVTVGLSGAYGSGKSSIVAMALKNLNLREPTIKKIIEGGKCHIFKPLQKQVSLAIVYLDAGLWEDNPDLFPALMLSIVKEFKVETERKVKNAFRKLLFGSIFAGRVLGATQVGLEDIDKLKKLTKPLVDRVMEDAATRLQLKENVYTIFKEVQRKVKQCTTTSECRLLIILDNLDRVMAEQTLNLLKSVYMYFPPKIPVFILACFDREYIERFLQDKYGITTSTAYLSKYIDFFWGMPLPKRTGINQVISKILEAAPQNCFAGHEKFERVLAGMLHKAGAVNVKTLEMILRRLIFLLHFYWNLSPGVPYKEELTHDTLQDLFNKVDKETDLVKQDFGLRVIGYFYSSLMYMRWSWLYNAFYLLGQSGQSFESNDIKYIISEVTSFCGKERLENEPYARSFLTSYSYLTIWFNPGARLTGSFRHSGIPEGSIREHIISELLDGAKLACED